MLYHASDRYIQEYFIDSAYPDREHVEAVYEFLRGRDENPIELTQDELKQMLSLPIGSEGIGNCEQLLEGAGVLERLIASQNQATAADRQRSANTGGYAAQTGQNAAQGVAGRGANCWSAAAGIGAVQPPRPGGQRPTGPRIHRKCECAN